MANILNLPTIASLPSGHDGQALLDRVRFRNERFLVAPGGEPAAMLVPISDYEQLEHMRSEAAQGLKAFAERNWAYIQAHGLDMEAIERVIDQAVAEVRAEMRASRPR